MQRLPSEAFEYYFGLGPARSYQAVAEHFHVHKRTVVRTADREEWATKLARIEKRASDAVEEKLVGELTERKLLQRRLVKGIGMRAAMALNEFPLKSGYEGVRAAELAIKLDRLLDGEATEHTSVDVEAVIRKECADLLRVEETDEDDEPDPDGVDGED